MQKNEALIKVVTDYKNGNADAFSVIYENSVRYMYVSIKNYLTGRCDHLEDVIEDMMQETYLEIAKNIKQLKNEETFLVWAGQIARRKCYAYLKKNHQLMLLDEDDTTFETLADDDQIIPEEIIQDKEKRRLLREIIEGLAPIQKMCIVEFYYNEQKISEIAKDLSIPENTVKTHLYRAKTKIKNGVLELEKKQNTKLYSIAPVLLLLLEEDIRNCIIPQKLTDAVLTATAKTVQTASSVGAVSAGKTIGAKFAAISVNKVIGIAVGVLAAGGIAGGIAVAVSGQSDSWAKEYKSYLVQNQNNADGFDLNDFDGDGVPELVLREGDTDQISIYTYTDKKMKKVSDLPSTNDSEENGVQQKVESIYGYGMNDDEIIEIESWQGTISDKSYDTKIAVQYQYTEGALNRNNSLTPDIGENSAKNMSYMDQSQKSVSHEEGQKFVEQCKKSFNGITYTDLNEDAIDSRINEFKENGNRARVESDRLTFNQTYQKYADKLVLSDAKEVTLSQDEVNRISTLETYLTSSKAGQQLGGQTIVPTSEDVWKFINRLCSSNFAIDQWANDKYLPERVSTGDEQTFTNDAIAQYAQNVFGVAIEDSDMGTYFQNGQNKYTAILQTYGSIDRCSISSVKQSGDYYVIKGTHNFGEWGHLLNRSHTDTFSASTLTDSYDFEMVTKKNEDSPFGYQLLYISYDDNSHTVNAKIADTATWKLADVVLRPEAYKEFYPSDTQFQYGTVYPFFAMADIDGDGVNELLLALNKSADKIVNILKYDETEGKVIDYDGDRTYQKSGEFFYLYDTGILKTEGYAGTDQINYWDLRSGKHWESNISGSNRRYPGEEEKSADELSQSKFTVTPEGKVVEGKDAEDLTKQLTSGNVEIIKWIQATGDNAKNYITNK